MNRRKGEVTGHMNERDFPHLVELALPPGGFQDLEFDAFHRERGIPIHCGSGHREAGRFYFRFCFPSAALALAFRDRSGAERLTYAPRRWGPQRDQGVRATCDRLRSKGNYLKLVRRKGHNSPVRSYFPQVHSVGG